MQLKTGNYATIGATDMQQYDLKTLADKVLQRNPTRNLSATKRKNVCNSPCDIIPQKLHAPTEINNTLRVYEYMLKGSNWLTIITPGYDLNEAKRILLHQYGERLVSVRHYGGKK